MPLCSDMWLQKTFNKEHLDLFSAYDLAAKFSERGFLKAVERLSDMALWVSVQRLEKKYLNNHLARLKILPRLNFWHKWARERLRFCCNCLLLRECKVSRCVKRCARYRCRIEETCIEKRKLESAINDQKTVSGLSITQLSALCCRGDNPTKTRTTLKISNKFLLALIKCCVDRCRKKQKYRRYAGPNVSCVSAQFCRRDEKSGPKLLV